MGELMKRKSGHDGINRRRFFRDGLRLWVAGLLSLFGAGEKDRETFSGSDAPPAQTGSRSQELAG
jgi:hypothetical protein